MFLLKLKKIINQYTSLLMSGANQNRSTNRMDKFICQKYRDLFNSKKMRSLICIKENPNKAIEYIEK